mmetsp:Transcript_20470/g.51944  ORF Transcript_20470/g.51944 Transcript_20470/m.51944 type:complete len:253 (-) Transcript_20470:691-1449(-)
MSRKSRRRLFRASLRAFCSRAAAEDASIRVNSSTLSITTPVIKFMTTTLINNMNTTQPRYAAPPPPAASLVSSATSTHPSPVTNTNRVYIDRSTPAHISQTTGEALTPSEFPNAFTATTANVYKMKTKSPDIQERIFIVLKRPSARMTSSLKNRSTLITRTTLTMRINRKMRSTPRFVPLSPSMPSTVSTAPVMTRNRSMTFHHSKISCRGSTTARPWASTRSTNSRAKSSKKTTSTTQDQEIPLSDPAKFV